MTDDDDLKRQAATLIELNEPEALLAALKRAAARKVVDAAAGLVTPDEAKRWASLTRVLAEAEIAVEAAQAPEARKPAQHRADSPPADAPSPPEAPKPAEEADSQIGSATP